MHLSYNQIDTFDFNSISMLTKLEVISLNSNNITSIESSCASSDQILKNLKAVYLDKCMIQTVKAEKFRGLTSLEVLSLKSNQIHLVSDSAFCKLVFIKEIYLDGNLLRTVQKDALKGATSLQVLNLSSNKIKLIATEAFQNLNSLSVLDLSSNRLRSLGNCFFFNLNLTS